MFLPQNAETEEKNKDRRLNVFYQISEMRSHMIKNSKKINQFRRHRGRETEKSRLITWATMANITASVVYMASG